MNKRVNKKRKKTVLGKLTSRRILLTIQLLVSITFIIFAKLSNILPMKYIIALSVCLLFLWIMTFLWMKSGHRKHKKEAKGTKLFFGKLFSVYLTILLLIGNAYIIRGNNFLDMISNAFSETHMISIYVLDDSDIAVIDDLIDKTMGISHTNDLKFTSKGVTTLEDEMDAKMELKEYTSYDQLCDAFFNKEVDCIIIDEAYYSILEEHKEDFYSTTKMIKSYNIVEEIQVSTTEANVTKESFIVYITGIDAYGDVSTVSRTDVNIVLVVNPVEKQMLMLSIPRDTQIQLATYNKMDKLTHSAMYGINETIETLEDFLKIDFNYYAKTNFSGIRDIIDQLGGVEIDSPYEFFTLHGDYHIEEGVNQMDGDMALCFVRERYALPLGDIDRGRNQQLLLKAMLEQAMSVKIMTNYSNILSAIEGSFETNMSSDSLRALINMQLEDMATWEIFTVQVTGEFERTDETYSMYGKEVETIVPDGDILNAIIKVIDKVESGERISEMDIEGLY